MYTTMYIFQEVDDQIKLMMSDLMDAGDAATAPLLTV